MIVEELTKAQVDTFLSLSKRKAEQGSIYTFDNYEVSVPASIVIYMNSCANSIMESDKELLLSIIEEYPEQITTPTLSLPEVGYSFVKGLFNSMTRFSKCENQLCAIIQKCNQQQLQQGLPPIHQSDFDIVGACFGKCFYKAATQLLQDDFAFSKQKNTEAFITTIPNSSGSQMLSHPNDKIILELIENDYLDATYKFRGVTIMDRLLKTGHTDLFDKIANLELNKKVQAAIDSKTSPKLTETEEQTLVATITRTRRI